MIDHLIHKITVVADNDYTAWKILQVLLENLQRDDIEVVCRLVEHQEVRVLHQHRAEVEFPPFATTEFVDIVMLLFGGEEKMLQEL